jgi:DNA-binding CsgD family transcriptional regulator
MMAYSGINSRKRTYVKNISIDRSLRLFFPSVFDADQPIDGALRILLESWGSLLTEREGQAVGYFAYGSVETYQDLQEKMGINRSAAQAYMLRGVTRLTSHILPGRPFTEEVS